MNANLNSSGVSDRFYALKLISKWVEMGKNATQVTLEDRELSMTKVSKGRGGSKVKQEHKMLIAGGN